MPHNVSEVQSEILREQIVPAFVAMLDDALPVDDPAELAARLDATPGVVEHGLFGPELVSEILIGRGGEVERRST